MTPEIEPPDPAWIAHRREHDLERANYARDLARVEATLATLSTQTDGIRTLLLQQQATYVTKDQFDKAVGSLSDEVADLATTVTRMQSGQLALRVALASITGNVFFLIGLIWQVLAN